MATPESAKTAIHILAFPKTLSIKINTLTAIAKSKFPYKAFKKIINKNDYELVRIVKAH